MVGSKLDSRVLALRKEHMLTLDIRGISDGQWEIFDSNDVAICDVEHLGEGKFQMSFWMDLTLEEVERCVELVKGLGL